MIKATPLAGLPEITPGFDLAAAIAATHPSRDDVVVIAHKAVSKSEGRTRRLATVAPGSEATTIAKQLDKDPRLVQVILDESREVVRAQNGVLITETRHGFVCANAGVDASNVAGEDVVLLLPEDPDASARSIRQSIRAMIGSTPAVIITDSFGRAWRSGQTDVAIGIAGLTPLKDWRGSEDAYGREMRATIIAVADLLAGTADLARRKDSQEPVVVISGAGDYVTPQDGPGAAALIRPREHDLFR